MKIDAPAVRKCLKSFDFKTLFREHLGWDNHQAELAITVNGITSNLSAIAEKRGFVAFVCHSIPDRPTRLKIDHQVTKSVREHFVVYADEPSGQQVWHWVRREPGRPLASRDHRFDASQSGDPLIQRLDRIAVSMKEEEALTLPDIAGRNREAFDVDKVTKKFYDRFKAEHAAFLKLIKGFPPPVKVEGKLEPHPDLQWYTSLMLNRLMFVYFIQKKGFLDGDTDYLRHRLAMVRQARGKDMFQSFYRYFLLRLFHDGLGKSPDERKLDPTMERLLGKIPYLNGGFFEVHKLETDYPETEIPDQAFEKLFGFFDFYSWHLDERPCRADNEINPDVVGYIFEKYINQKQMGAYYTKEDITEYISKNTIIPFLFDTARKKCAIAFKPDSALWRLLRDDPNRYIYPAVGHGVTCDYDRVNHQDHKHRAEPLPLPTEIEAGVKEVAKRDGWNRPAPEAYALPTETWREVVARRQRCLEVGEKLRNGEVHEINDLITLNLDIWQFARDAIVNAEGPELLRAFWHAIAGRMPERSNEKIEPGISILDPTCGSGAFLFAALRILETLYSDCLERMERFLEEIADRPHHPKQFSDFKDALAGISEHRGARYFILKSIIIKNLFGVDIMEEAVEICKLRLFLKLVAQVETVDQLEPLPDIDFNIRAGNTLVGFASRRQLEDAAAGDLIRQQEIAGVREDAEDADALFQRFQQCQRSGDESPAAFKKQLQAQFGHLRERCDGFLAEMYQMGISKKQDKYKVWKTSHQPFHWFVEFYGIMSTGGFDVIIGNPPYMEVTKLKGLYRTRGYATNSCANLYAFVVERSARLSRTGAQLGVIVPIGSSSLDETLTLRELLSEELDDLHAAHFAIRPAKLFTGVEQRLSIYVGRVAQTANHTVKSTKYNQWFVGERDHLFACIQFAPAVYPHIGNVILKTGNPLVGSVLTKVNHNSGRPILRLLADSGRHRLFFHRTPGYWVRIMDFLPYFSSPAGDRSIHHIREVLCENRMDAGIIGAVISSSVYFLWLFASGNCRNLTLDDVKQFPLGDVRDEMGNHLQSLFDSLMESFRTNSFTAQRGASEFQQFRWERSKPIIDEIDRVLAKHYGFTDEELDFIINYDIKYRMGGAEEEIEGE